MPVTWKWDTTTSTGDGDFDWDDTNNPTLVDTKHWEFQLDAWIMPIEEFKTKYSCITLRELGKCSCYGWTDRLHPENSHCTASQNWEVLKRLYPELAQWEKK